MEKKFSTFKEFYPFYLSQHENSTCRYLHYIGSLLVLFVLATALYSHQYQWLWLLPVVGYGLAWIGHFFFEKNRPATFKYPVYSLIGDWVMLWDWVTGRKR